MRPAMKKYPRTPHLAGSRLQPGDEDLDQVPFAELAGRFVVAEEKMDGANAGISFSPSGELLLQSRGHYLDGGPRERHFALLKQWAGVHVGALHEVLGARYVLYGEWLYAKHTCFYDRLPHYFMEFDVYDREQDLYLSTAARAALLGGLPVVPVRVLYADRPRAKAELLEHLGPSCFKSDGWRGALAAAATEAGAEPEAVASQTDGSDDMEGLYLKVEDEAQVLARLKFVRASFHNAILDSGGHWLTRKIVPNRLADDVDLWASADLYGASP
ncbi:MAG: RNA ligase family protein [Myxococcales bacterium]|nr:RNA ligase family protein [Myxococcales bacterium]